MGRNTIDYPHRKASNGLYDSICPTCFATVARSKPKAEMAELENAHVCDSALLAERGLFARPSPLTSNPVPSRTSQMRAASKASDLNHLQQ
jgi:hypothetical protein